MDDKHDIDRYCDGVLSGDIVAGRLVKLAVRRHLADLLSAPDRGFVFDERIANESIAFFPNLLRHSKGEWAGKPFELSDNQKFCVWNVYGWQRTDTGHRRFTRAYLSAARKWGKTELAAGLCVKSVAFDEPLEPGARVYAVATKEQQARDLTFDQACAMVRRSPALKSRLKMYTKSIVVPDDDDFQPGSVFKPLGSDSDTSDGLDQSVAIVDELHAWRKRHRGLYQRMTTAGGARRQELVVFITTAGDEYSEIWQSVYDFNVRVLESVETGDIVSDNHFAYVAEIDDDDNPFDEAVWLKANPNYPITPKPEYLRNQANELKDDPIGRNTFMRFHANKRVRGRNKPVTPTIWRPLAGKGPTPTKTKASSVRAFGGFDLGRSDDFSAWAVVQEGKNGEPFRVKVKTYTCEKRRKELQNPQLSAWIDEGWLEEHSDDSVDFTKIQADIIDAHKEYGVTNWAFDPAFAKLLAQNLIIELGEDSVFQFVQSPRMYNEVVRSFLRELKDGNFEHDGDPCFAWQMYNLATVPNAAGLLMPDKGGAGEYKIDAAVAFLMAFAGILFSEAKPKSESIYSQRGAISI